MWKDSDVDMTDTAYIVSRILENKIAIAENNGQNALLVTLDGLKEILALLKEQEEKQEGLPPAWQDRTQEHICQRCGGIVWQEDNYCSKCGQAVKWT